MVRIEGKRDKSRIYPQKNKGDDVKLSTEIKKCTVNDLEQIQNIAIETYNETYSHLNTPENMHDYLENAFSTAQLKKELDNEHSTFFLLLENDAIAGYLKVNVDNAQTQQVSNENALEIERIYVKSNFQDRGLGRILLNKGIEIARDKNKHNVWLGVWNKNKTAIDFHKNMGFEVEGEYSVFVGDEEHVNYIMVKSLND